MSSAAYDFDEMERSAKEAAQIKIRPLKRDNLKRYENPTFDTAFPLEYAFWLLGDARGKTILDLGCGSGESQNSAAPPNTLILRHVLGRLLVQSSQQQMC